MNKEQELLFNEETSFGEQKLVEQLAEVVRNLEHSTFCKFLKFFCFANIKIKILSIHIKFDDAKEIQEVTIPIRVSVSKKKYYAFLRVRRHFYLDENWERKFYYTWDWDFFDWRDKWRWYQVPCKTIIASAVINRMKTHFSKALFQEFEM